MKVLFLDVDGVLNTTKSKSLYALSRPLLRNLQEIVEATGCKLVLSSSWRKNPESYKLLQKKLQYRGLKIEDSTPRIHNVKRGVEIQSWLDMFSDEVEKYAIVDDDSDMLDHQLRNFFQTDPDYGLTNTIGYRIVYHLTDGSGIKEYLDAENKIFRS